MRSACLCCVLAVAAAAACRFDLPPGGSPPDAGDPVDAVDAGSDAPAADGPPVDMLPAGCGAGYNYEYNGHRYRLIMSTLTWAAAKADCEASGGYLLKIETAAEDQQIENVLGFGPSEVWIGLSDVDQDGTYLWTDGTPPSFTHWSNPPGPSSPDCVAKNTKPTDGRWFTRSCGGSEAAVCECNP